MAPKFLSRLRISLKDRGSQTSGNPQTKDNGTSNNSAAVPFTLSIAPPTGMKSFLEWQRDLSLATSSESRALTPYTIHVLNCTTSVFTSTSNIDCKFFSSHSDFQPAGHTRTTLLANPAKTIGDESIAVSFGLRR